jgi:hypothetical protein
MNIYPILKVASTLSASLFGIIGILTSYKDKDGNITKWGKIATVGIGLSAALSIVLYGLESAQSTAAAEKAKNQYDETRTKLDKALADSDHLLSLQGISLEKSHELEKSLTLTTNGLNRVAAQSNELGARQSSSLKTLQELQRTAAHLNLWEIRKALPATPLTIVFAGTYSMDGPEMKTYITRLRRRSFAGSPLTAPGRMVITGDLYPNEKEEKLAFSLQVLFKFSMGSDLVAAFNCTMDMPGRSEITADFQEHFFYIYKECTDLYVRPIVPLSAVDLAGTTLTWEVDPLEIIGPDLISSIQRNTDNIYLDNAPLKIEFISLRLPYTPDSDRQFDVRGTSSVVVTEEDLGIRDFLAWPRPNKDLPRTRLHPGDRRPQGTGAPPNR